MSSLVFTTVLSWIFSAENRWGKESLKYLVRTSQTKFEAPYIEGYLSFLSVAMINTMTNSDFGEEISSLLFFIG